MNIFLTFRFIFTHAHLKKIGAKSCIPTSGPFTKAWKLAYMFDKNCFCGIILCYYMIYVTQRFICVCMQSNCRLINIDIELFSSNFVQFGPGLSMAYLIKCVLKHYLESYRLYSVVRFYFPTYI